MILSTGHSLCVSRFLSFFHLCFRRLYVVVSSQFFYLWCQFPSPSSSFASPPILQLSSPSFETTKGMRWGGVISVRRDERKKKKVMFSFSPLVKWEVRIREEKRERRWSLVPDVRSFTLFFLLRHLSFLSLLLLRSPSSLSLLLPPCFHQHGFCH